MRSTLGWLGVGLLALAGCTPEYLYRPAENVSGVVGGRLAARYAIPPEQPRGELRVASFGFAELKSEQEPIRALHIRWTAANTHGRGPWFVDTREQYGIIPGEGRSRPAYASSDAGGLPIVRIDPGDARTIDLFYPLPETAQNAAEIPQFDVLTNVQTDTRLVSERTPFERLRVEPEEVAGVAPGGWVAPGWGPYWWYDPLYPTAAFVHPPTITRGVGRPVFVTPPHWH
jgi:hypothetical protein